MMWFVAASLIMVAVSLAIGVLGYHFFNNLSWIDSILNASMILGGMGPVAELHSRAGKLFASAYALFSGLAIIGAASVMLTPIVHRLMHKFHMQLDDDNDAGEV